jgi:xanthine dehydrogenase small subunit
MSSVPDLAGAVRPIRFVLDGAVIEAEVTPTTTVLEYLRDTALRTGTKEGCAEGDCGACTVVLGELSADGTRIRYRTVNSCLRLLPTIDACELITVESLPQGERLHPVQQAMVDWHASQCGFCTPGFVMSLFGLYLGTDAVAQERDQREPTYELNRDQVIEAIAGNLCRCTGYRPIIDAGCHMHDYPAPTQWSRSDAQSPARIQRLVSLQAEALCLPGFIAPATLDELAAALEAQPEARVLAGGTDLGLLVTKELRELPALLYLGRVAELQQIEASAQGLRIGAAVPLIDAWAAILEWYPALAEVARRFASPPICNSGTLCGNIANGSPIGDSMPILLALDAHLELRCGAQTRRLALDEFYLGYRRTALARGELIVAVEVPRPSAQLRCASYKIAKRFDQDISTVCVGIAIEVQADTITRARVAFGGMAATPARAQQTEAQLVARPWCEATWEAAQAALAQDFTPLSDQRGSGEYRLQVAANLLRRFYLEQTGAGAPLRVDAVDAS